MSGSHLLLDQVRTLPHVLADEVDIVDRGEKAETSGGE